MAETKARRVKRRKQVRKEATIHVRVTEDEKATLTEAASRDGMGVSSWLVMLGLRGARKQEL